MPKATVSGTWSELASQTGQTLFGIKFMDNIIPISNYTTTFTNESNPEHLMIGPTINASTVLNNPNIDVDVISSKFPKQTTKISGPITLETTRTNDNSSENTLKKYIASKGWISLLLNLINEFSASINLPYGTTSLPGNSQHPSFDCAYKLDNASINLASSGMTWSIGITHWGQNKLLCPLYHILLENHTQNGVIDNWGISPLYHFRTAQWFDCAAHIYWEDSSTELDPDEPTKTPILIYPNKMNLTYNFETKEIFAINNPFESLEKSYERNISPSSGGGPIVFPTRIKISYEISGLSLYDLLTGESIQNLIQTYSRQINQIYGMSVIIADQNNTGFNIFPYQIITDSGYIDTQREPTYMKTHFMNKSSEITAASDNLISINLSGDLLYG